MAPDQFVELVRRADELAPVATAQWPVKSLHHQRNPLQLVEFLPDPALQSSEAHPASIRLRMPLRPADRIKIGIALPISDVGEFDLRVSMCIRGRTAAPNKSGHAWASAIVYKTLIDRAG